MSFISIYITHASEQAAQELADQLLAEKLIACANIFPIYSSYRWQGTVHREKEWVSLVKSSTALWDTLRTKIEEIHPYDTPCIMKSVVEANLAYEQWINDSVNQPASP